MFEIMLLLFRLVIIIKFDFKFWGCFEVFVGGIVMLLVEF